MQALSPVWCIDCVTVCQWVAWALKRESATELCFFSSAYQFLHAWCSNRAIPSERWNMFRGQEEWSGWLNMECTHRGVLVTCIWLCHIFTPTHGRAWPTAMLSGLFGTFDTWALPSTCYINPTAMLESWATSAINQGTVADVCLLEKCHSHPQLMKELTLGDACNCTKDMQCISSSCNNVQYPLGRMQLLQSASLWASCLVHIIRVASEMICPVFSVHHGILTYKVMTVCCCCRVSYTHCDSPPFGLEVGCPFNITFSFWFFSVCCSCLLLL